MDRRIVLVLIAVLFLLLNGGKSAYTQSCVPVATPGPEEDSQCPIDAWGYNILPGTFYKAVPYTVSWPDGTQDSIQVLDYGECWTDGANGCCAAWQVFACFPSFYPPTVGDGIFEQKTYSGKNFAPLVECIPLPFCNVEYHKMDVTRYCGWGATPHFKDDPHTCNYASGDPCADFDYSTCDYSGGNGTVDNVGPSPGCCGPSPILIDLSGGGFHLTDAEDGVNFDLDSDGVAERIGWTALGSSLGFLCLDRNGNGIIDNGKELFGNFTPQPTSPHPNGFLALAVYDQPGNGGNGDGIIDSRDAIFSQLRIWVDSNHNGISEPGEIHTLTDVGVTAISLDYSYSFRQDQFGNRFRYFARVFDARGAHDGPLAYDVYFVRGK